MNTQMTTTEARTFTAAIIAGKSDDEALALVERMRTQRIARTAKRQAAKRTEMLKAFDLSELLWGGAA